MDLNYIASLDYRSLADSIYEGKGQCKSGVIYCQTEHIKSFFERHANLPEKYVLLSACCDYGIYLAEEHPVKADLSKGLAMMQLEDWDGFTSLIIPPRCNVDLCKKTDKYSVKCYAFTHSTFNKIPDNITRWFLVNANIDDPRVIYLPLGLYHEGATEVISHLGNLPAKQNLLYLNWTNYTLERVHLKQYFRQFPWAIVDDSRRPFKEFLLNIASFKYILCPEGNGLDSHRIWESLYLGCVPIMIKSRFAFKMAETFPAIMIVNDWSDITESLLQTYYESHSSWIDLKKLDLNYWAEEINRARLLC